MPSVVQRWRALARLNELHRAHLAVSVAIGDQLGGITER
jgi:hypothetical protein